MLMVLSNDLAGYCPKGASESCIENEPGPTFPASEPLWMHNEVSKPLFRTPLQSPSYLTVLLFLLLSYFLF